MQVEDPCFYCIPSLLQARGLDVWGVPTDDLGIVPAELEKLLSRAEAEGKRVSMVYFIPVFNNPKGHTMPSDRRGELVQLCAEHKALLVADEASLLLRYVVLAHPETQVQVYQMLSLSDEVLPLPMCSYGSEYVASVSSVSKILSPGLGLPPPPAILPRPPRPLAAGLLHHPAHVHARPEVPG